MSRRCWRGRAGFPTRRTGSILKWKKRLSPTPSNTRPMARSGSVTNCASVGVFVSPGGVRGIWLRHDLAHFKARLKALEAKVAEEGIILTEAQIQALEKKKCDDEAWGGIDTAHPGYLGSQDTVYAGTLKGVGRVYQQTCIDTYAKAAEASDRRCWRWRNRPSMPDRFAALDAARQLPSKILCQRVLPSGALAADRLADTLGVLRMGFHERDCDLVGRVRNGRPK